MRRKPARPVTGWMARASLQPFPTSPGRTSASARRNVSTSPVRFLGAGPEFDQRRKIFSGLYRDACIQAGVRRFLQGSAQCLIVTGGTGAGQRDLTIETVTPLLEKVLPGFGELFRWLSYGEVGSAAMLSRALCGVSRGKVVCCLPGSEEAVRLALCKVLLPELPHLIWVASR